MTSLVAKMGANFEYPCSECGVPVDTSMRENNCMWAGQKLKHVKCPEQAPPLQSTHKVTEIPSTAATNEPKYLKGALLAALAILALIAVIVICCL